MRKTNLNVMLQQIYISFHKYLNVFAYLLPRNLYKSTYLQFVSMIKPPLLLNFFFNVKVACRHRNIKRVNSSCFIASTTHTFWPTLSPED